MRSTETYIGLRIRAYSPRVTSSASSSVRRVTCPCMRDDGITRTYADDRGGPHHQSQPGPRLFPHTRHDEVEQQNDNRNHDRWKREFPHFRSLPESANSERERTQLNSHFLGRIGRKHNLETHDQAPVHALSPTVYKSRMSHLNSAHEPVRNAGTSPTSQYIPARSQRQKDSDRLLAVPRFTFQIRCQPEIGQSASATPTAPDDQRRATNDLQHPRPRDPVLHTRSQSSLFPCDRELHPHSQRPLQFRLHMPTFGSRRAAPGCCFSFSESTPGLPIVTEERLRTATSGTLRNQVSD